MSAKKSIFTSRPLLFLVLLLFSGCSSYKFHSLLINGSKEYNMGENGCKLALRANQVEPLGIVNLQFQVSKGMLVQLDELKIYLDGEQVPAKKILARYRGQARTGNFEVTQVGTLTLTLEKSLVVNKNHLQLQPCAVLSCHQQNLITKPIDLPLKDL